MKIRYTIEQSNKANSHLTARGTFPHLVDTRQDHMSGRATSDDIQGSQTFCRVQMNTLMMIADAFPFYIIYSFIPFLYILFFLKLIYRLLFSVNNYAPEFVIFKNSSHFEYQLMQYFIFPCPSQNEI